MDYLTRIDCAQEKQHILWTRDHQQLSVYKASRGAQSISISLYILSVKGKHKLSKNVDRIKVFDRKTKPWFCRVAQMCYQGDEFLRYHMLCFCLIVYN